MTIQTTTVKTTRYSNVERGSESSDDNDDRGASTSVEREETYVNAEGKTVKRKIITKTIRKTVRAGEEPSSPVPGGFISRFSSLPFVHDSVTTLQSYALDNKYGRYALDTANSAVSSVNKYTESIQPHLQPHLEKVDQFAGKGLGYVETTFPIVAKPTSEIVDQVKKPFVIIGESSGQAYTQLQSTIDTHLTSPAKNATNNITAKATTAATQIASNINTKATPLVDGIETIVNRYLPGDPTTGNTDNQAARVVELTRSVSSRVSTRLGAPQSAAEIRRIAENNVVYSTSKRSLLSLNASLTSLLDNLRTQVTELQASVQHYPGEVSLQVQSKISVLNEAVVAQFGYLSNYLKENSPRLPESIQIRIQPLVTFVSERYLLIKSELLKSDVSIIQKARNILVLTTQETIPILHNAAQEVKVTLTQYQVILQDNIQKGLSKVSESPLVSTATRTINNARVSFVGAK